jgi:hypothetical protein
MAATPSTIGVTNGETIPWTARLGVTMLVTVGSWSR